MKKHFIALLSVSLLAISTPVIATQYQQGSVYENQISTFFNTYIANRLSIGARFTHRILTDSDSGHEGGVRGSGTYLGTIYAIDEVQNYFPFSFIRYDFTEYIGVELAYDSIEGETLATSIQHPETGTKSDGDVSLTGFTVTVIGSYPNESRFTPYCGLGIGYFQGDFEETDHWALGYYSEPHYAEHGSPGTPYNGRRKWMNIDDTLGFIITAGTKYELPNHWFLDASLQYIMVDADAHYEKSVYDVEAGYSRDGTFPLDNLVFRFGIGYTF